MHTSITAIAAPAAARRIRARPAASADDHFLAGSLIDTYTVIDELGRGGMASVYDVIDRNGDAVALKIPHRALIDTKLSADTFLREARLARAVDHPGVTAILGTGSFDNRPYLVTERLIGMSLGTRIDHGDAMPRIAAIEILLELCDILREAHAAGIVHRDLKPDNVFLLAKPYDGLRRVKLLDWGVSHAIGEDDPFRGLIAGTLTYVAPEHIRGEEVTGAADIYSLAVLAFRLLCRRTPFMAATDLALLHLHLNAPPPRPSLVWPEVPPTLDALISRMLAKNPTDRPGIDEIERVLRAARAELAPHTVVVLADVLGRPRVRFPLLASPWIGVAIGLIGVVCVLRAFS